jgi:ActR/RegA family two-component response regulator
MMMAHDSSQTPPSRLDDETVAAVRAALRAYLANPAESAALQRALLRISAEARERAMLPEQLLVVLKDLWGTLPEVRAMTDAGEQVRLLQRVVTMCIKEYYSV